MNQSVTLRTPTGDPGNTIAGTETTYTEATTTMYLEPRSGREDTPNRNTPIGDWLGVGLASVDWDSWQQVVYGVHVFEIVAPPRPFYDPLLGADHHVELDLQEVT